MPYVPSKKTDEKSTDREIIDAAVEKAAREASKEITNNLSVIKIYREVFENVLYAISKSSFTNFYYRTSQGPVIKQNTQAFDLGRAIAEVGASYDYEGAYLGELNYAITRFIQRVPQIKVENGEWKQELRYWLYAATIEALTDTADGKRNFNTGISGVFEDIKDEYKRRVNTAYEAEQILKSGDCYDTPYYTKVIEVADENGKVVGHMEVMLKRSEETLHKDSLDMQIVVMKKSKK
ncbi:MAG: hypothetical protein M1334_00210 [Patescibacteria group bacterium]|nr:hypothetical protein [Patescibacteria group bacterium]